MSARGAKVPFQTRVSSINTGCGMAPLESSWVIRRFASIHFPLMVVGVVNWCRKAPRLGPEEIRVTPATDREPI